MSNYAMYGFCKSAQDEVGYLAKIPCKAGDEDVIADDIKRAKLFPETNENGITGFGSPKQWLDFVNSEFNEIYGPNAWKFHLVKTCL